MAYAHTNSKGTTYYLHSNGRMFFFSKEIKDNVSKNNALLRRIYSKGNVRREDGARRSRSFAFGSTAAESGSSVRKKFSSASKYASG